MVLNWKKTAIIFIILFLITLGYNISTIVVGHGMIEKEYDCSSFCYTIEPTGSYSYDYYSKICECWLNGDIIHRGILD